MSNNLKLRFLLILSTALIPLPCLSITNLTLIPNKVTIGGSVTVSWVVQDADPTSLNLQFVHNNPQGASILFPGISSVNNINPHATSSAKVTVSNNLLSSQFIGKYDFDITAQMSSGQQAFTPVNSSALSVSGVFGNPPNPSPSATSSSSSSFTTTTSSSPSSSITTTADPSTNLSHSAPIGAIVGGTIGGLGAIALVLFAMIWMQRRKQRRSYNRRSQPFTIEGPPPPLQIQIPTRQNFAYGGATVDRFPFAGQGDERFTFPGPRENRFTSGAREEIDYGPVPVPLTVEAPRWDVEVVPPTYERVFPSATSVPSSEAAPPSEAAPTVISVARTETGPPASELSWYTNTNASEKSGPRVI